VGIVHFVLDATPPFKGDLKKKNKKKKKKKKKKI
jgi:hypothetical protein